MLNKTPLAPICFAFLQEEIKNLQIVIKFRL